jgi:hypothetical protein
LFLVCFHAITGWYQGEITHTLANEMRWVVRKDQSSESGQEAQVRGSDHDEIRSCYHCVKPRTPLRLDDEVQFKGQVGKVVRIQDAPLTQKVDFRSAHNGFVTRNIPVREISRSPPIDEMSEYRPNLQEQVLIYNEREDDWSIGLVVSVLDEDDNNSEDEDGPQYTVSTDDGPEFLVTPDNLRPLHFSVVEDYGDGDNEEEDDDDEEDFEDDREVEDD